MGTLVIISLLMKMGHYSMQNAIQNMLKPIKYEMKYLMPNTARIREIYRGAAEKYFLFSPLSLISGGATGFPGQ